MRVRRYADRPDGECPECGSTLDNTQAAIFICGDAEEALRIAAILQRLVLVKIAEMAPRRLHRDGTYTPRPDIVQGKHNSDYWYSASGLKLEAVRLTWGPR